MEIERKYLVARLPEGLDGCVALKIEQGYLNKRPTLRIRKSNDSYYFTYKGEPQKDMARTDVCVHEELEAPLTKEAFEHLKEKCDDHIICKTRYLIPLENGLRAELDIFQGRLEGLRLVEVEFPDFESADSFVKPDWFGDDVSSDKKYTNANLSLC